MSLVIVGAFTAGEMSPLATASSCQHPGAQSYVFESFQPVTPNVCPSSHRGTRHICQGSLHLSDNGDELAGGTQRSKKLHAYYVFKKR